MSDLEFVAVRIPKTLKSELESLAKIENVTVSDLVREALNAFLKKVAEFTPLGSQRIQKLLLLSHLELLRELYLHRSWLFAILSELRKDLTPDLREMWDKTQEGLRDLKLVEDALKSDDWNTALARLLKRWGEDCG